MKTTANQSKVLVLALACGLGAGSIFSAEPPRLYKPAQPTPIIKRLMSFGNRSDEPAPQGQTPSQPTGYQQTANQQPLNQQPVNQQLEQPAPKPQSKRAITVENLWDRWSGRKSNPPPAPTSNVAIPNPAPQMQANEPIVAQENPKNGDFPVFRASGNPPVAQQPMVVAVPPGPEPAPVPRPQPAPTEPTPSILRTSVEPAPPAEPPRQPAPARPVVASSPQRRTYGYLNDEVRYGSILRARSSNSTLDPTANILDAPTEEGVSEPAAPPAAPIEDSYNAGASIDEEGDRPTILKPHAEDLSLLGVPQPTPAAEFSGRLNTGRPSQYASPAALQQAIRRSGAMTLGGESQQTPTPAAPPAESAPNRGVEGRTISAPPQMRIQGDRRNEGVPIEIDSPSAKVPVRQASAVQKRSLSGPTTGKVIGVNNALGVVQFAFPANALPEVGSRVMVYQKLLFKRVLIGELDVVKVDDGIVSARPLKDTTLELVVNGDEAVAR